VLADIIKTLFDFSEFYCQNGRDLTTTKQSIIPDEPQDLNCFLNDKCNDTFSKHYRNQSMHIIIIIGRFWGEKKERKKERKKPAELMIFCEQNINVNPTNVQLKRRRIHRLDLVFP